MSFTVLVSGMSFRYFIHTCLMNDEISINFSNSNCCFKKSKIDNVENDNNPNFTKSTCCKIEIQNKISQNQVIGTDFCHNLFAILDLIDFQSFEFLSLILPKEVQLVASNRGSTPHIFIYKLNCQYII